MSLPTALYRTDNLQRAWRWIRSNPDAGYKTYFRDLYSAYAIAQDALLNNLSERLKRGAYSPAPASKVYFPKASGILRPYSLLEVEDQIVYQAAANIVAECMFPKVRHRYMKQVFGHLYAGKSNIWFYRKWSNGYRALNKASTDAVESGLTYTASFDLTAFYDSIDHQVLRHFLGVFGVDRELAHELCRWLSTWTATDVHILQGHGIPQGPLSSGLIAEAVLSHMDNHSWSKKKIVYLRYVDDIRLFARSEFDLRKSLIKLDRLSKDIGLFPQSSKIDIRRVTDIRSELKTISQPVETVIKGGTLDQERVRKRLRELSPHYRITDRTRFKYVLSHAVPNARLTKRLWRILDESPEFYAVVARYLARASKLPRKTSLDVVRRIEGEKLYPAVSAAFLRATAGSLHPSVRGKAKSSFKKLWAPNTTSPDFTVALGQWLLAEGALTDGRLRYVCRSARSSWVRSSLLLAADDRCEETTLKKALCKSAVIDGSTDPAMVGAVMAGRAEEKPGIPVRQMHRPASLVLKEFGLVRRAGGRVCGINASLTMLLGRRGSMNWKRLFGKNYRDAERQLVSSRGYASTDATAWVNGLDVFDDLLLDALHRKGSSLGGYTLGNIGGCTNSPSRALQKKYPKVLKLAATVHNQRYKSDLAHARVKATQQSTGRIPFKFIRKSKRLIGDAIKELADAGLI
ncbi:MAG: RNA-directed DNA polymerase [Nitrosospira sp.]|nr:RNA-directed DNA polymerase [Nitrosospira sp.]